MIDSILVIIRSSGERTTELCEKLIAEEITKDNIIIIREAPFTNAVRKTFELGIESNLPWTLAIDADVLIRSNAIRDLLQFAQETDDNVFELQELVLDKLFLTFRPAGNHLYRTSFLPEAIGHIPHESSSGRPETTTIRNMESQGHPWVQSEIIFGLHDYEQHYCDIYRKGFQHGKKHRKYIPYLEPLWHRLGKEDPDYHIALMGLGAGLNSVEPYYFDAKEFEKRVDISVKNKGFQEKGSLPSDAINGSNVNRIIENFKLPPEHSTYLRIFNYPNTGKPPAWFRQVVIALKEKGVISFCRHLLRKGIKALERI